MKQTKYIWMDGKFVPWKKATIHVLTHSLHYGSAVFEGIRVYSTPYGSAIFRLDEHVKRLFHSASVMGMRIPVSQEGMKKIIIKTVKINKLRSGYIRPIVYYGAGKMGLSVQGVPVRLSVACWPWGAYLGTEPVKVMVSNVTRINPKASAPSAKISGTYFNSILASEEAKAKGFDEAILLDEHGYVSEGPGENIFVVKNNVLYTPKLGNILPGITRDAIITLAQELGIKVVEDNIKKSELYKADEAFFTGTAAELSPIAFIDKNKIGSGKVGPVTARMQQVFKEVVSGKDYRYRDWLTLIR